MSLKTVIFDLDDTLLWDKKSIADAFLKTCKDAKSVYPELKVASFEQAVRMHARKLYECYPTYPYTVQIGINPFEGLWGHFDDPTEQFQQMKDIAPTYRKDAWTQALLQFGIDDAAFGETLAETFIKHRIESPCVYEDTFHVLDQLKGEYQLILLTNGAPSLQNKKLAITPELVPYFDEIIISGDFGIGKPDPSIFEHVAQLARGAVEESVMIGDNLMTDILGSNRIQMRNIWINRERKTNDTAVKSTYEVQSLTELLPLLKTL